MLFVGEASCRRLRSFAGAFLRFSCFRCAGLFPWTSSAVVLGALKSNVRGAAFEDGGLAAFAIVTLQAFGLIICSLYVQLYPIYEAVIPARFY